MQTFPKIFVLTLTFILGETTLAQDDLGLVRQVSETYRRLRSFEFGGHLTATIPASELQMRVNTFDAKAGPTFVPEHSTVRRYGETLSFRHVDVTDTHGKAVAPDFLQAGGVMPSHWGHYEEITTSVTSVKELAPEVIQLNGKAIHCRVLEIVHNRERWKPEENTIKYWVDGKRLLVVKEEFAQRQGRGSDVTLWRWVYTVDSVKLNQAPPKWLVENSTRVDRPEPRPEWVGREAPDITLHELSGREVRLSELRGKVVLLDFWATWCGPCKEEMPVVGRIAAVYKARSVETWGISDEGPAALSEWLTHNQGSVPILVDAEGKASEQFQVEGIPALVVIGGDGKIVSYYTGTQSEKSLRAAIDLALNTPISNK